MSHKIICCLLVISIQSYNAMTRNNGACSAGLSKKGKELTATIDQLLKGYDNRIRPNAKGNTTITMLSIGVVKIHDLRDEGTFGADVYLRLEWIDPRLCHNDTEDLLLPADHGNAFWHPDVFFENALKSYKHDVTAPNNFYQISPNGDIIYSLRVTLLATCPQDLTNFPFDVQTCELRIVSYSYRIEDLTLKWKQGNPATLRNTQLMQFTITGIKTTEATETYATGQFSTLVVQFYLQRRIGYYIFQVFIPCITIVALSFVSFWMNPEDIEDRIALGISSVLTIVFLMTSINTYLPKVSYIKNIDIYLIGCFALVFATVLETAVAFHFNRKAKKSDSIVNIQSGIDSGNVDNGAPEMSTVLKNIKIYTKQGEMMDFPNQDGPTKVKEKLKAKQKIVSIDNVCKVMFPLFFIVANIFYWSYNLKGRA